MSLSQEDMDAVAEDLERIVKSMSVSARSKKTYFSGFDSFSMEELRDEVINNTQPGREFAQQIKLSAERSNLTIKEYLESDVSPPVILEDV